MEWKEYHDNLLRQWRKHASISLWLSLASKYMYTRINNWLSYPVIVLSVGTSIGIAGLSCDPIGNYVMSGLTVLTAIFASINQHVKAAEKAHEFYMRAKDYYSLIREIDYILALDRSDRPEPNDTLLNLRNKFDKIIDQQYDFPLHIIREYEKKFRPIESAVFTDLEEEKITDDISEKHTITNTNPLNHSQFRLPSFTSGFGGNANIPFKQRAKRAKRSSVIMSPYQLYNGTFDAFDGTFERNKTVAIRSGSKTLDDTSVVIDITNTNTHSTPTSP